MKNLPFHLRLALELGATADPAELLGRMDALARSPGLAQGQRVSVQRAAVELLIRDGAADDAWRRYRRLALDPAVEARVLARLAAGLGDLAAAQEDPGAISRARAELARLLALARERLGAEWDGDPDWPALNRRLFDWDAASPS